MAKITALAVTEPVRIDGRRFDEIIAELGEGEAEHVILAALDQLSATTARLAQRGASEDFEAIAEDAQGLARLAWQVGLVSLAGVAIDVGDCAKCRDRVGMAATLARAVRVSDESLDRIYNGQAARP